MNQLKFDPTRTSLLRRQFVADMRRRFKRINSLIYELIVKQDIFGLIKRELLNPTQLTANMGKFEFLTDENKIKEFKKWLKQQVDAEILVPVGGDFAKPWMSKYIDSAFKQGMMRAYTDVHYEELTKSPDWYMGTKEGFLRQSFAQPETTNKIRLIYTRTYSDLQGVTTDMDTKMSRSLANGLVQGKSPLAIAREMSDIITNLTRTRAELIARSEIIHAHAEGQLDAFEQLGVEKVSAEVEFLTAGDDIVCWQCEEMNGKIFTIEEARGLIPLHPNCRCCWLPAIKKSKE